MRVVVVETSAGSSGSPHVQTPRPESYGNYEIVRELAQGMHTTVYEARQTCPNSPARTVALKVLRRRDLSHYFEQTAKLNAILNHPYIPRTYGIGVAEERWWYSVGMFVEGDNLQKDIGVVNHTITDVVKIIADIAGALDYAHEQE